MSFKFSNRSLSHMQGIEPQLLGVAYRALEITRVDFGIPASGGFRTADQQKILFDKGITHLDGVTYKSKHQLGRAIDFYAYVKGNASWDLVPVKSVALAFMQAAMDLDVPLKWGGWWVSNDLVHFELAGAEHDQSHKRNK